MSSKLAAANNVTGIPFLTPYPFSYSFIKAGTRTAGLTALMIKPIAKQNAQDRSVIRCVQKATTTVSVI